jgi:hypothetical protein
MVYGIVKKYGMLAHDVFVAVPSLALPPRPPLALPPSLFMPGLPGCPGAPGVPGVPANTCVGTATASRATVRMVAIVAVKSTDVFLFIIDNMMFR